MWRVSLLLHEPNPWPPRPVTATTLQLKLVLRAYGMIEAGLTLVLSCVLVDSKVINRRSVYQY
jgi:hypothetical protein